MKAVNEMDYGFKGGEKVSRIGTNELLLIFAIALIVFGPSRLPMLGKIAGKTLGQLKGYVDKVTNEFDDMDESVIKSSDDSSKKDDMKKEMKKDMEEEAKKGTEEVTAEGQKAEA